MSEKSRIALMSVLAALLLTMLKLVVGIVSGSLGIVAEALNSGVDVIASLITFGAVRIAEKPADESHRYGHGKAENLGALIQGVLVLLTIFWIGVEALRRLFYTPANVETSFWSFAVMLLSIIVSAARVRTLRRAAAEHNSQALEADALHFYTDIYTGAAVLLGLAGVWLGERYDLPLLLRTDSVAALLVGWVLLRLTLDLLVHAVDVLLDRAHELTDAIAEVAVMVHGVERVHGVRARQVGAQSFVDMRIDVARATPFEQSHAIATAVEQAVRQVLPDADVVVHVDPVRAANESLVQAVYAIAHDEALSIHHITLHGVTGRTIAHMHVELDPALTLRDAHSRVDHFERRVVAELPVDEVVIHIEPASDVVAAGRDVTPQAGGLVTLVERIATETEGIHDCHDVTVQQAGQEFHVALHCTFDPHARLDTVHHAMESLERRLRDEVSSLGHIVIHPEPLDE